MVLQPFCGLLKCKNHLDIFWCHCKAIRLLFLAKEGRVVALGIQDISEEREGNKNYFDKASFKYFVKL